MDQLHEIGKDDLFLGPLIFLALKKIKKFKCLKIFRQCFSIRQDIGYTFPTYF